MNVSRIAKSSPHVDACFEEVASSTEETLLHSYDRFYRAVNKLCKDVDVPSIPKLESLLGPKIPKERMKQLKSVWECAEKFVQVQGVVHKFHRYRHDLAKKARRRSRTASLTSTEIDEGMKEMQPCKRKLELSENALSHLEAKLDQLPGVVSEAVEKLRLEQQKAMEESLRESRQQMNRLEQWMRHLDAKVGRIGPNAGADVTLTCMGWPETMHNNIVYSTSESESERGAPSSELIGESVHDAMAAVQMNDVTAKGLRQPCGRSSSQKLRMQLEARPIDTMPMGSTYPDAIKSHRLVKTIASISTSPSLKSSSNKEHRSSESGQRETLVMPVDDAFDEAFLRDVIRVQENIRSSDLGRPPSIEDEAAPSDVSQTEVPIDNNDEGIPSSPFVAYRMESISFLNSALSELRMDEPTNPFISNCDT